MDVRFGAVTEIQEWIAVLARIVVLSRPWQRFTCCHGQVMLGGYWATRARDVFGPVVPLLATDAAPKSGSTGRFVGVAYRMLTVHVPPAASGVADEQVVPVMLNRPPKLIERVSAVTVKLLPAAPVLVMVTTLVTAARGLGMVNVSVRVPNTVASVPFVAEVKLSVPGTIPVPVSVTGDPVTTTPAVV